MFYRLLKQSSDNLEDEDADVAKERRRVLSGGAKEDVLRIEELTKVRQLGNLC